MDKIKKGWKFLKTMFIDIGKLILGLVLFIISVVILVLITPWGVVEAIINAIYKRTIGKALSLLGGFFSVIAIGVDMTANVMIQVPANRILIKPEGHQFGNPAETFSRVLGINMRDGTYKKGAEFICKFLNVLDKNHCEKSI